MRRETCPTCGQSIARPLIDPQTLAGFDGKGRVVYDPPERIVATGKVEGGEVVVTRYGTDNPLWGAE